MDNIEILKRIERLITAILTLQIEKRESELGKLDKKNGRNIEVLLAEIGFSGPEVAKIVNKSLPAVQKAIQRGRKK